MTERLSKYFDECPELGDIFSVVAGALAGTVARHAVAFWIVEQLRWTAVVFHALQRTVGLRWPVWF